MNVPFNMGREGAGHDLPSWKSPEAHDQHLDAAHRGIQRWAAPATSFRPSCRAIADPIVGLLQNRDAFNRPIAKEDIDKSKPTPGWTRAKEGATGLSKKLAYAGSTSVVEGSLASAHSSPTPDPG